MSISPFIITKSDKGYLVTWPSDKFVPIHTRSGFENLLKFLFETCKIDIARLMVQRLDSWEILYIDSISFYQNYQGHLADAISKRYVVMGVVAKTEEEAISIRDQLDKQLVWKILKD
jgi:hypothetical protein